jgi:hypothetical protein
MGPVFQPLLESVGRSEQFIGNEAVELIRKFPAAEDDGDAARSQRCRQPSVAGKSLGASDEVFLLAMGIAGIYVGAAIEKGHDGLPLRRTEAVVTIIHQEGHGKLGMIGILHILLDLRNILPELRKRSLFQQSTEESAGGGGGHEGRLTRKQIQQLEADRFPALGFRRADIQVGNGVEAGEAPGIGNPQGKDGELVMVTEEKGADESFNGVEALKRCSRWVLIVQIIHRWSP